MKDIKNWSEVTKGLYSYFITPNSTCEIRVLHWYHGTDIMSSICDLYVVGEYIDGCVSYFKRELLLTGPMLTCLCKAVKYCDDINGRW